MNRLKKFVLRRVQGAAMAELGPALFILLICFFFPVVILLGMCISYCSILLLNNLQIREAAVLPYEQAQDPNGSVKQGIPANWLNNGVGKFVNPISMPQTQVTYKAGSTDQNNVQDQMVVVTTTCSTRPMLQVSFFGSVPGLNAPVNFTVNSERVVENQDNAPP